MASGLMLDFGGVLLLTPFELRNVAERELGLRPGSFDWAGPFDPSSDELWRRFQAGELTERDYWAARALLVGEQCGRPGMSSYDLFRAMYEHGGPAALYRHEGLELVAQARDAGIPTAILTNDLEAFHGPAWVRWMDVYDLVDEVVDGSRTGYLKPDRRAYEHAAQRMGLPADAILFVDDQPVNVAGAHAAGLQAMHFDVVAPEESFAEVSEALALD